MKKKNFKIQILKLRNEQNPFEKPAKNLEQNSLDSLLTSTTWRRGKKRNQKPETEKTKAAEEKKKKKKDFNVNVSNVSERLAVQVLLVEHEVEHN